MVEYIDAWSELQARSPRYFYAPQTSTDLETIEFAQRRQRSNSPVRDHEVSMEFADMGGSGVDLLSLPSDLNKTYRPCEYPRMEKMMARWKMATLCTFA
ncbi:hypothetical protein BS47DRAFT_1150362 [Hydnum rufescens UP504]|uniref:Uncharacterized protein n=1 Tax=Hydnum rufescens UP504 TaxID=1448309 RepID=A0A9P6E1G8_9AGAM|nr:hypothetical protein BS47DRAFT_1150362 [Hydnum rufescens UP504]